MNTASEKELSARVRQLERQLAIMALGRARPAAGLILYSDRGSEFLCHHQGGAVIPAGIFASRQAARMALFNYIEVFYNRQQLHSGIDYPRPASRAA